MKITASEEYGIRLLIRIAQAGKTDGLSIPQLSEAEGLSEPHVGKLCRTLRLAGFINSTPGYKGGYILSKMPEAIIINDVLKALGGTLFDDEFCESHSGIGRLCTNSVDCATRSLWRMVQFTLDNLLNKLTLQDLMAKEKQAELTMENILIRNLPLLKE
ncbi:MAG: Rrf2 family transcriptional regulator [Sphingobacteriales bacterium]|nr:MAG: Rrf2 family transcriptional regulator [Sphingobacteriales bacterium]